MTVESWDVMYHGKQKNYLNKFNRSKWKGNLKQAKFLYVPEHYDG
jgi:hypothetical protein